MDFKYPAELTQTFMSSNLIGGFFNRLEASRKYLFGSMGVLGQTNDSLISGALIARGQDIKPVVDVAPDWESYDFRKLDLSNEADKAFFEAALAWDLEIDGKKWVDGKNVSFLGCMRIISWMLTIYEILPYSSSRHVLLPSFPVYLACWSVPICLLTYIIHSPISHTSPSVSRASPFSLAVVRCVVAVLSKAESLKSMYFVKHDFQLDGLGREISKVSAGVCMLELRYG